eukprot:CAMPEP_0168481156 /NCGR_PEP_ID=MMETSP0228-20121227/64366_1 /TAXON_ID=133427 /ORGANISM="Protoceratium reticulatum, Strain CCCM 535 (=CCMP 1889)" /LENGTH=54 /DNA_ID=CAMNT_0008497515 /DNA_START=78 /DNA_END=239 /DNA_ORIENTATION=-
MKASTIFCKMGGKAAQVSKRAWDEFFAAHLEGADWDALGNFREVFRQRAARKLS